MPVNLTISPPRLLVVKVSGHLSTPDHADLIARYARVLGELRGRGLGLAVVVGGGSTARRYIAAARGLGADEATLDLIGVRASRLNAMLLIAALGRLAYPIPPESLEEVLEAYATGRIVVCGGLQPGQSTNAVSALIAEALRADVLVNMTTVDAVYTADPEIDPSAKPIPQLTVRELRRLLRVEEEYRAGGYKLMDPLSLLILERSRVPMIVTDGRRPEVLREIAEGRVVGTLVTPG